MKIASKKAIPNSSVARAEVHCFLCQPCAIPLFVLLMLLVPAVPDAGRRPAHPGKTRCIQAALPENITDAGRRPVPPGKTRCIQAALPENITDAGRRPAHPGRPRGRKMVTGEPDRNLTSPTPLPFGVIVVKIAIVGYNTSRNLL